MLDDLAGKILKDVNLDEIAAPPLSQRSPVAHWPQPVLLERAAYLRKMARFGDGSASETIRECAQHSVQLVFHSRSSEAHLDQSLAHLMVVLSGAATLVTGGKIVRPRTGAQGQTLGDAIEGGGEQQLRPGDVVHIPAAIPHQLLIAGDKSIALLVVKMSEES
jgi:mannose-6-phosphate isomerase-like protein (cupin superfamily)